MLTNRCSWPFVAVVLACFSVPAIVQGQDPRIAEPWNRAWKLQGEGKNSEAVPLYLEAIKQAETLLGDSHQDVASLLMNLGNAYRDMGQYAKAERSYLRAIPIREAKFGKDHLLTAQVLLNLGYSHYRAGAYEKAEPLYVRAIAIREAKLPKDDLQLALSVAELALVYSNLKQYAKAESLNLRALAVREAKLGKDHPDVAYSLANLANVYYQNLEYEKAEPLYLRAIAIREAKLPKGDLLLATTLSELANNDFARYQYARAETMYRRALAMREAKLGKDHPDVAYSLTNIGQLHQEAFELEKAEPYFQRALAIHEQYSGKEHIATIDVIKRLANLHHIKGDLEKAASMLQGIHSVMERNFGKESAEAANSLSDLAGLFRSKGDFARSIDLYQRALDVHETSSGKDHPITAFSLLNLGSILEDVGSTAKAEPLLKRALEIYDARFGKGSFDATQVELVLGHLYTNAGRYSEAEPRIQNAIAVIEAKLGKDNPRTANALHELASLYKDIGQYGKAEPLYKRIIAIQQAKMGQDHPQCAGAMNDLALLYFDQRQYEKAEAIHLKALAIREAKLARDHLDTASTLHNLGSLYIERGDLAKAEPLFLRALEIFEKHYGADHSWVGSAVHNLGVLYRDSGQYDKAASYLKRGLIIHESKRGKDNRNTIENLQNLAILYAVKSDWGESARYQDLSRRRVRGFISATLPILSQREQQQFLESLDEFRFHRCLSHGLERREHPRDCELSAGWLLNGKAVSAQVQAESVQLARETSDPRLGPISRDLTTVRQQLASLTVQPPKDMDAATRNRKAADLSAKEQELSRQLSQATGRQVTASWIELADVRQAIPKDGVLIEIARFGRRVVKATSMNEKDSLGDRYAAWIIPAVGEVRIVDLGEAKPIDEAVRAARGEFEAAVKTIAAKGEPEAEKQLRKSMETLSKLVMEPMLPHIRDSRTWILSPDGQLWLAPWSALPLADGSYAIEKHALQFVVTGRDLLTSKNTKVTATTPMIMADPDFNAAPKAVNLAGRSCAGSIGTWKVTIAFDGAGGVRILNDDGTVAGTGEWTQNGTSITFRTARATFKGTVEGGMVRGDRVFNSENGIVRDRWEIRISSANNSPTEHRGLLSGLKLGSVKRLPGTAVEAEAILPRLEKYVGMEAKLLSEQAAAVAAFKSFRNPKVVILSTHGFFLEAETIDRKHVPGLMLGDRKAGNVVSDNPLLRCGLLLAGCNHAGNAAVGDTGVLTGLEIVGTDLRGTELVLLSACETGLGDVRNGEGVAGLRQAFQLAGAESVVATLWQVPDRDSALLMSSFFEKLSAKQARDVALAEAQREMIQKRRDRFGAAHPYYWAAYTLTGQTK